MSPTQLLQREAFLGPAGLERLARMRRDGIVSEPGPIVASDNRENGKPGAKPTSLLTSPYYLIHKSLALSMPYETSTPHSPQQKKVGNVVVDAQTNEILYEDTGLTCSFTGAAVASRNADGSYKISTPDVRKNKGKISFEQTANMDTSEFYSLTALPQTMQVDMSALPGGKAPFATPLTTGPSFASMAAPDPVFNAPSPSSAFTPLGGLNAEPITFQPQATHTKKSPAPTPTEPKIQVIDEPNNFQFRLEA